MINPLRNERGAALAMALLFLMVLSILVAILHQTTISEILSTRKYQEGQKVFFAAEAGIREGLEQYRKDSTSPTPNWYYPIAFDKTIPADGDINWSPEKTIGDVTFHYYTEFIKPGIDIDSGASLKIKTNIIRITAEGISSDRSIRKRVQLVTQVQQ